MTSACSARMYWLSLVLLALAVPAAAASQEAPMSSAAAPLSSEPVPAASDDLLAGLLDQVAAEVLIQIAAAPLPTLPEPEPLVEQASPASDDSAGNAVEALAAAEPQPAQVAEPSAQPGAPGPSESAELPELLRAALHDPDSPDVWAALQVALATEGLEPTTSPMDDFSVTPSLATASTRPATAEPVLVAGLWSVSSRLGAATRAAVQASAPTARRLADAASRYPEGPPLAAVLSLLAAAALLLHARRRSSQNGAANRLAGIAGFNFGFGLARGRRPARNRRAGGRSAPAAPAAVRSARAMLAGGVPAAEVARRTLLARDALELLARTPVTHAAGGRTTRRS